MTYEFIDCIEKRGKKKNSANRLMIRVVGLSLLLLFITFAGVITVAQASEEASVVVYGNMDCESCYDYIMKFEDALKEIGITSLLIKDIGADPEAKDELHDLYDRLEVPIFMVSNVAVVIDGRIIFGEYVPVEIIADFLVESKEGYQSFVVYRDETRKLYIIMDEDGEIIECRIVNSIEECFSSSKSTITSFPILPLIIVSGLLDGINPCAFAVLLFFLAFLFAVMKNAPMREIKNRIIKVGAVYIAAIYIGYLLIGVGLLEAISLSPFPHLIALIGALVVIVLGIISIKDYFYYGRGISLKIPYGQWKTIARLIHKATIPSTFLVGLLVAFVEFPCTGGIYVAILGMLAAKETQIRAIMYLLIYNLAFVLPLVLILAFASNRRLVERLRGWQEEKKKNFRLIMGLLMMAVGIVIIFGYLR